MGTGDVNPETPLEKTASKQNGKTHFGSVCEIELNPEIFSKKTDQATDTVPDIRMTGTAFDFAESIPWQHVFHRIDMG